MATPAGWCASGGVSPGVGLLPADALGGLLGCRPLGRLAQLEERHVHTVEVMGSRPVSPTSKVLVRGCVCLMTRSLCSCQMHKKCTGLADTGRHGAARCGTDEHSAAPLKQLRACARRSQNHQTIEVREVFEVLHVERRERDAVADAAGRDPHVVVWPRPATLLCAGCEPSPRSGDRLVVGQDAACGEPPIEAFARRRTPASDLGHLASLPTVTNVSRTRWPTR